MLKNQQRKIRDWLAGLLEDGFTTLGPPLAGAGNGGKTAFALVNLTMPSRFKLIRTYHFLLRDRASITGGRSIRVRGAQELCTHRKDMEFGGSGT